MSSSSTIPKPKKGHRELLGGSFSRPRSRLGSRLQQQPDVGSLPPTTGPTEGTGFTPSPNPRTNTTLEALNPAKQAAYDSSLAVDINRRSCTQGTRVGVLADLDDWLYNPVSSSVYLMSGTAGTGKTTIAFTFCELAEKREILAASFFCTRSSAECRKLKQIVPTIAYQLSHYSTSYRNELCKVLEQSAGIGSKNVLAQFELLLRGPLREVKDTIPGHSVVVIDALDECEDRNGLGLILDTLFHFSLDIPLKFLITSRPDPEIYAKTSLHRHLREAHLDKIAKSLIEADIERYFQEELSFMVITADEMKQLVQRSETFFINAATLFRYIASNRRSDPHKRLHSILNVAPDTTKSQSSVDVLYTVMLKSALEAGKKEDTRTVLRTVLLAHEPVNISTIASLTGIEDPQRVMSALDLLRWAVHYPRSTGLISTFHASFTDFIFDNERSGPYSCDATELNEVLAQRCFTVMKEQLRFNICDLNTSFIPDDRVDSMQTRVNNMIPPSLAYTCRYWVNYLSAARRLDDLLTMLDEFLCHRLLFWIEVLSLRRHTIVGIEGLLRTKQWLDQGDSMSNNLVMLIEDARNFVAGFAASPASQSTPHIYISSLPFCPRSSLVYKHYWKRTRGMLELNGSLMEHREAVALATWNLGSNILSIACSPQGEHVAVACFDKTVRILNAYDGIEPVGPLTGHTELAHSVAFSPDGRLVASGSYDGTVRVWNADNGTPICVAHSRQLDGHICYVNSVSFSHDGTRVVSGSAAGTIRVWDATDGSLLLSSLEGHGDWIRSVAYSPNGALIASASDDKTIRLWYSHDGTPASAPLQGHTHWVMSVSFSPDNTRLASGSRDHTVRVWNVSDGSLVSDPFRGHKGAVHSVIISPDGTRIASGSSDGTVRVWNILDGTPAAGPFRLIDYTGSALLVTSVAFSFDGTRVISSSYNRAIHVWDVRFGDDMPAPPSPLAQNNVPKITSLAFSPDSTRILSSCVDNAIRLWDTRNGSFTIGPRKGQLPPTSLSPFSPAFSPDGRYFAGSFEDGVLDIMSTANSGVFASLSGEDHRLSAFRFSQDSNAVISGRNDGAIQIWDLKTGKVSGNSFIGHSGAVTSIAQSLDSSLLASYSRQDKTLRVWDMRTPILDLEYESSSSPNSASELSPTSVYDGWRVSEDGWVVNNHSHLLFWLPADIVPVWRSPYASLVVTEHGTLLIPKQRLLLGSQWSQCYIP